MKKDIKLDNEMIETIIKNKTVYYYNCKDYDIDEIMIQATIKHLIEVYSFSIKESLKKIVNYFL